jgi:hypothetical protein
VAFPAESWQNSLGGVLRDNWDSEAGDGQEAMTAAAVLLRVLAATICLAGSALAQQNWAEALVEPRQLNFGVIATGSESVKQVMVTNRLQVDLQIAGVTTACQCAQASLPAKQVLRPGEQTAIEVRMNTLSFQKQRDTTLSITFGSPQLATVQVPISAYIRTDIVFDPGKLDFGTVEYGRGVEQTLKISYAGRPDWTILKVNCANADMECKLEELSRNAQPVNGVHVEYALRVRLSAEAKPGRLLEYATLETDDAKGPSIPFIIQGTVLPDIAISNPRIDVRALRPGQTAMIRVVVRGTRPFVISGVNSGGLQGSIEMLRAEKSGTEEKLRIVELKFTAPNRPGRFSERMQLMVEGREEPLEFSVSGTILSGGDAP